MAAGEDLRTLGFNETEKITTQMAKTRFKKLAKETHPDRPNGDKEEFQRLQSAFIRVLRALEAETRSPEGSTHCMSCYMAVMDAWREKKENGVAGQVCFNIEENKTITIIVFRGLATVAQPHVHFVVPSRPSKAQWPGKQKVRRGVFPRGGGERARASSGLSRLD